MVPVPVVQREDVAAIYVSVARPGGADHVDMHVNGEGASIDQAALERLWITGLSPTESVYDLMPPHVLEDVDIPFLLKDAPIVDVHVELPMVGKTVNV
jgi:hypothetical protein